MIPPGFGPDRSRSNDGGSHGLAALRFPQGEVPRMEATAPAFHSEYYSRQGPPSQLENGNGRPQMMIAAGTMGMSSPGRSAPAEIWDIKAMAAHRHRALVAESSSQRMELVARMQTIPPQACPPGFRPPPLHSEPPLPNLCPPGFRPQSLHSETPLSNVCPPGFRPPSVYNEAVLLQGCPPGFRPPIQYVENSAIMQSEMKFRTTDPNTYRPEFRLDDRPGDPIGIHDTMRGSPMYGATDRRGWYPNESSSGAGRVCENRCVDPQVSKPYILPSQPQDEHVLNQSHGAKLENDNWRRETLPQHARPLSPSVPVSKVTPPLALYPEAFWPGNIRDDNLASTAGEGKRRSFEGPDNNPRAPPFKRPRTGHEVDSPPWARSRRDPEFERTWSNGLRMSGDRSRDCEESHPSSLSTQKQAERRKMTEYDRTVGRWRDRQESRTRRSSPHNQRRSLSPRDKNRAPFSLVVSQKSELRTRPSSFRPISQSGRSSLRAPPRPLRSNSKEKQHRNNPYFDIRSRPSNCASWSPSVSLRSRSPNGHPNYHRRSLSVDERSLRKVSWSPRLLAGKSSSAAETDEHAAHWRSTNIPGKVERKAEQNGSARTFHSSPAVGEYAQDGSSRSDSQFLDVVAKPQAQQSGTKGNVVQEANNSLDSIAPASTDKIKNQKGLSLPLRAGAKRKVSEMEVKAGQRGRLEKNLPLQRNSLQFSDEKSSSSFAQHMATAGGNKSARIQPVSAKSLKITRNFTNFKSLRVAKFHISQDLEVNWKMPPQKVTPRRRRNVVVSADPSLVKISGSNEGAALPPKEREANITKISSPKLGQNQDELQGGILHTGKSSKSLLGLKSLSERSSIASETGFVEGGLIKPYFNLSRLSSEVTIHPPSGFDEIDSQLTAVSVSGVNERTGQKVIFTGHRREHIPSVKLRKMASGSGLQSPESLGKSQSPGGCLLAEDAPGNSCTQQMEVLPTLTVRKATETNEGFQPNGSTSESLHVSVKSELQDSFTSGGDKLAEQLGGFASEKTTSLPELLKVMTDKEEAALVQGEQDVKVVPQPSDLRDASAMEGENLGRQPDRVVREQADSLTKLASFLTDAGAAVVTEGTEVMSIVPQISDLQDSTIPGGNNRAEQHGQLIMGGADSSTELVRITAGEREAIVTEGKEDLEVTAQPSGEVAMTVFHFDRELGKRRKIMHPEKGGNLKQVITAEDATVNDKKTNVLESSNTTEENKADSILVKNQMPSLKSGIQRTVPVLKPVDTLPRSSHLAVPPAVTPPLAATPPLGTVGRSYRSNKTWRREAMDVSTQRLSDIPRQRPALVAQPSAYVRKKFSIVRFPAAEFPLQSNVSAQPNALSKCPQGSVTESGNKSSSSSASKSIGQHQVNIIRAQAAAAASPNVKTSNTKTSYPGAMPSEKPKSSSVQGLNPVGDKTLVTHSELIVSDLTPVSKVSPSTPSHSKGSSGLATVACSPVSKPPGRATNEVVGYVVSGTKLYRQRKSNQVLFGPSPTTASPTLRPGSDKCDVPLGYIKRKTNQLVRCSHQREASANDALQNVEKGGDQVKFMNKQRRYSAQLKTKTKLGRVLSQKKGRILGLARVWTLSNEGKHTTAALGVSRDWRYPLFPWKRVDVVAPRLRRGRPLHEGKMGALFYHISNQLQKYRSGHPVYTRSADGFSLHRSGVMSKSGANLKWTKSLMTQSILASEAATKVVAEAEKKKRDKKEAVVMAVTKARDERRALQASAKQTKLRSGSVDSSSVSSLKPLGIGGAVYVRKGFGNQLVRDSRTVARAFASEKFKWSLRNARLRRAKKQTFCVYYTRFGVCKRGDGKCLYIHDPEKIAVCTKFLRGSCSDSACRLTHKVIPERMSDCSYFLEGLCTNDSCPYRHVNVDPKAPNCEGFLQGYCADGDSCNKKHTYVCSEYTLTGKCSSSNCKLRHLTKTKQPTSASKDSVRSKREGRYFAPTAPAEGDYEGQPVSTADAVGDEIAESGDDRLDFISIDEIDLESSKQYQDTGTL